MKYLLLILMAVSVLVSCGIDPQRKKKDRTKLIELLAKEQTDSLKIELDSLCVEAKENEFDFLVDSVLEERLVEIQGKLEEYQK
ncbi:MAG: hypothetical protein ACI94Y_000917 [Maribacter sp.]|jgi:hypothetical protein